MLLCISVYQSFVLHLCLSAVYKSSVLHLDLFAYMSPVYAIPGGEHSLQFFLFVSFFFETVLFVSVVSIGVRNTETNRKIVFFVSRNKPKNNRNRLCFGSFRFKPKIYFVCFEDTLTCTQEQYSSLMSPPIINKRNSAWCVIFFPTVVQKYEVSHFILKEKYSY
jgi:hypothetical protein